MRKFVVVLCLFLAAGFLAISEKLKNLGVKIRGRRQN